MLITTEKAFGEALLVLNEYSTWCVDIESNGLDAYGINQLCGIGIAVNSDNIDTFYFPFRHQQGTNLHPTHLSKLLTEMGNRKEIMGYNLKFDLRFLVKDGLKLTDIQTLIDVMLPVRMTAHTTIRELALTKTIRRLFSDEDALYDIETKKILRSNKWSKDFSLAPPDILGPYCELDAYWTLQIFNKTYKTIIESRQEEVLQLEYDLTRVLFEMEAIGITLDTKYGHECIRRIDIRKEQVAAKIYDLAGHDFNIRSNPEIGEVFHKLGIYSKEKTAKGAESWGSAALAQINHPMAGLIREYRALTKLASTYLEPYIDTPILHTSFCNWGTVTGRLSSREPNLQNIPRNVFNLGAENLSDSQMDSVKGRIDAISADASSWLDDNVLSTWSFLGNEYFDEEDDTQLAIRRLFIPRTGFKLLSIDYSQMEVRVFLSYIDSPAINELLQREDVDFHSEAAKVAFDIDEDNPEFKYYRQLAKGITFGLIYGIGNDLLAKQLSTTKSEASKYKKRYLDEMPGSNEFIRGVMKAVSERGWVKNRFGRVYVIPKKEAYKGINYLVQGTSADILNERLIEIGKYLSTKKSNMLLQVHDEVILEISDDETDIIPELLTIMQTNTLGIPLFCDVEICEGSWAIKKEYVKLERQKSVKNLEKNEMAKVNSTYNASIQRKWGWEKIECVISDIDTELPLEPQLMDCSDALDAVFSLVKEKVLSEFSELSKPKPEAPEVNTTNVEIDDKGSDLSKLPDTPSIRVMQDVKSVEEPFQL
tara:strand:- start:13310 stop:15598 length:2289 start_codon:yes stop_codon:yes gene_type:complete